MRLMGFSSKWINWMMRCVTTVIDDVNFNGMLVGLIIPKRGLRQGDPLSPYLFLFCVEGLSNALDNASEAGRIQVYRITPSAPVVSHPPFADDSFSFSRLQEMKLLK